MVEEVIEIGKRLKQDLSEHKTVENVEVWYRKEIINNRAKYPNLYAQEIKKNQFKFNEEETKGGNIK